MTEFSRELESAGDALQALADGPGREAAEALETAFGRAGERIEAALKRAARTGELDFERMSEAILRDLARLAAETLVTMSGIGGQRSAAPVQFNMHVTGGTARGAEESRAGLAAALTRLVNRGGRYL